MQTGSEVQRNSNSKFPLLTLIARWMSTRVCAAGSGEASATVHAMRALPQQQQLVMCATAKLLGQADNADALNSPCASMGPGTPTSVLKVISTEVDFPRYRRGLSC